MNNHVKIQHYVPRLILKNFSSKGDKFIWTYDKNKVYNQKDKIKERSIKYVAYENYFYDKKYKCKEGSYEYKLKEVENTVTPIIKKIIKFKSVTILTTKERKVLSHFISLQIFRTKGELNETENYLNILSKELKEKGIITEKSNHREIWFSILEESMKFTEILLNKIWSLSISNESFYISDNPITFQNTTDKSEIYGTLGIDSYGIEIYFPLTPSIVLCLFCEKMFKETGYNEKYINNIFCENKHIKNLNSLQIQSANRFIFSHKNDFKFVNEVLIKN